MVVGMETALWWMLPPLLSQQWEVSSEERTVAQIACITFFSVGTLLAGHAADFYGRYVSLLFLDSTYMIMTLLSSIAPTAVFLLAFRCSCALLAGGRLACALPLAMEICPRRWRFGAALVVASVGANLGSFQRAVWLLLADPGVAIAPPVLCDGGASGVVPDAESAVRVCQLPVRGGHDDPLPQCPRLHGGGERQGSEVLGVCVPGGRGPKGNRGAGAGAAACQVLHHLGSMRRVLGAGGGGAHGG
eukprot:747364-Hanusia_phi.AAC.9